MAKAIVEYEDLRDFASHLKSVIEQLNNIKESTSSKLNSLDWDDNKFREFESRYYEGIVPFKGLEETLEEFIQYLSKAADIQEEYHNLRS